MKCDELKVRTTYVDWKGGNICYYDPDEVDAAIAELKEERRWRKFPEEKPVWGKEVLMIDKEGKFRVARFSYDFKWISWGKMHTCESDCIAFWMPLPKKPEDK